MDYSGLGTAIMLVLAAVLWFFYLLPTWLRRREYLASERTALRLQRTIRAMAETAEVPEEVRLEASAREAFRQEKILRKQLRLTGAVSYGSARAARRGMGLLLLGALIVAAAQLALMFGTGVSGGALLVLFGCVLAGVVSVTAQRRMRVGKGVSAQIPKPRAESPTLARFDLLPKPRLRREWTPVPLPRPLYLERGDAPRTPLVKPVTAAELLEAARAEARRVAEDEGKVLPFVPKTAPKTHFDAMGRVDVGGARSLDLDEVLRRRRLG